LQTRGGMQVHSPQEKKNRKKKTMRAGGETSRILGNRGGCLYRGAFGRKRRWDAGRKNCGGGTLHGLDTSGSSKDGSKMTGKRHCWRKRRARKGCLVGGGEV